MTHAAPSFALPAARVGPRSVVAVLGERQLRVRGPAGEHDALLAVAGDYQPRVGDELLVLVDDAGQAYAIAVLRGLRPAQPPVLSVSHEDGRTVVRVADGDLELRAEHGSVRISARDRIDLEASLLDAVLGHFRVRAELIETTATRLVERLQDRYAEVRDLCQTHAGRVRTVVDDTFHLLARRNLFKALEDMKLKAGKIHLG